MTYSLPSGSGKRQNSWDIKLVKVQGKSVFCRTMAKVVGSSSESLWIQPCQMKKTEIAKTSRNIWAIRDPPWHPHLPWLALRTPLLELRYSGSHYVAPSTGRQPADSLEDVTEDDIAASGCTASHYGQCARRRFRASCVSFDTMRESVKSRAPATDKSR